ncbi:ABC transporter permease [Bacillus sp. FJAT-42315]|uniref:ABC transporter permease n=1 Tax=Bacillus sp. FJAT-42315 TaxID=2014077 RepID=UPI000C246336|nr:ABC transporter permease [Bacillus sp. FJAT-42315]
MNSFWLMLSQSYINKFKTKAFLLTTIIVAIVIMAGANFEKIVGVFDEEDEKTKLAAVDESGTLLQPLKQQLSAQNSDIQLIEATKQTEAQLTKSVENEKYEGYILLKRNEQGLPTATYKALSVANSTLVNEISQALQMIKGQEMASQLKLSPEEMALWNAPVDVEKVALAKEAKSEEEMMQAQALVYILLFFIYLSVIIYANMIASEVAIEKSSRVMEILISSVSPVKQMFAKIIGIGLLGITQMAVWFGVAYYAFSSQSDDSVVSLLGLTTVSAPLLIYAIVFFILGYFLYATIAALLGSLVSRLEDVQQMMMPLTFSVMIGFFLSMYGLGNPESSFITITSYIPFFTPMIMFVRVGMLNIPMWEVATGIGILLVSIILLAVIGARIYRGGVLIYGKSSSLKDIKKAIQLSKHQ